MSRIKLEATGVIVICSISQWPVDARKAGLAAQNFQRAEQRRRGLAAANGDADRLEHLAGFDAQFFRGGAQRGFQSIMRKFRGSQRFRAFSSARDAIAASPFFGISSAAS